MQLQAIIPDPERLFIDSENQTDYTYQNVATAHAVALPNTADEIIELVEFANHEDLSIIARGSDTGVAGSQVPITGGELFIDVQKMNLILEWDEEMMTLTVEPGAQLTNI